MFLRCCYNCILTLWAALSICCLAVTLIFPSQSRGKEVKVCRSLFFLLSFTIFFHYFSYISLYIYFLIFIFIQLICNRNIVRLYCSISLVSCTRYFLYCFSACRFLCIFYMTVSPSFVFFLFAFRKFIT